MLSLYIISASILATGKFCPHLWVFYVVRSLVLTSPTGNCRQLLTAPADVFIEPHLPLFLHIFRPTPPYRRSRAIAMHRFRKLFFPSFFFFFFSSFFYPTNFLITISAIISRSLNIKQPNFQDAYTSKIKIYYYKKICNNL